MAGRGQGLERTGDMPPCRLLGEIGVADRPRVLQHRFRPSELGEWTPSRLRALLGDRMLWVEYSRTGLFFPRPSVNGGRYFRKQMLPADALERIVFEQHYPVPHYISALEVTDEWSALSSALPILEGPGGRPMSRVLFVGNSLSGTHAHYDLPNNTVLVLAGEKRFTLFAPDRSAELRPYAEDQGCSNFSSLADSEIGDLASEENTLKLTVGPGEMIYIPSCWWHRVTNRGFTISLTNLWPASDDQKRHLSYRRFADSIARRERAAGESAASTSGGVSGAILGADQAVV